MTSKTKNLNNQQLQAIKHGRGPLLIIAGAGTGKTTVITERFKWLILKNLAKPSEILALTFTEKAAQEMEERVDQAMPYGYTQMWISTFHAFCDRVLRDEGVHIGLDPTFRLMTEAESVLFLRQHLFDLPLNYFRPRGNPTKFIEGMLQHFNRIRDEDVSASEYLRFAKTQNSKLKTQNYNVKLKAKEIEANKLLELAGAFKKYQELKEKEGVMDFADLISNTLRLFRERPNVLRQYQKQFKYILVDEFQDTNIAQYELVKLLAPPGKKANLAVVGDDSQSIYKFRGAAVSNILQFQEEYKTAKMVTLIKNYRSTQTILNHAYQLIKHNDPDTLEVKLGIDKNLKTVRKVKETPIEFIHTSRVEDEAERVIGEIKKLRNGGKYQWKDFAILVRANDHSEPFIRALQRHGIPYQFLGPGMLFRQPEVKELIAYLKVLYDFEDDVAMYRLLAMDFWEISGRDLAALMALSRRQNLNLFALMEGMTEKPQNFYNFSQATKEKIGQITAILHRHFKLIPKETAGQILYYFLQDSGMLKKLMEVKTEKEERRVQNMAKFFDKLKTYEADHEDASVYAVVDWMEMKMSLGESPQATDVDWTENDAVNILTVHSAKGLEFPVVFLVNLVSQRFPTRQRREQIPIPEELIKEILPSGDAHEQEERRLFYVGMTRAKDRLYLTAADYYGEGKREKKISPFVWEAMGKLETRKQRLETRREQLSIFDFSPPPPTPKTRPTTPYPQPISYLSYSQLDTFKRCPLQYKYKNILRIPAAKSHAASFGSSIHSTLRNFYLNQVQGKKQTQKDLLILLEQNWVAEGYQSKKHELSLKKRAKKYLRDFYKKSFDPRRLPLAIETNFKIPLKAGLIVGGKIDRVDKLAGNKIEIIDYKTGENPPDQKSLDRDLQLSVYALAATSPGIYNKRPEEVILSLYFFDGQKKISTERTVKQLKETKEEILKTAEEITKSDFQPTPGTSFPCSFCEYRLLCDAWK